MAGRLVRRPWCLHAPLFFPRLGMFTGLGDDGPAITVAHQNHRPVHGVDGRLRILLVLGVGSLGRRYTRTLYPSFLWSVAAGSQPEPSAKTPCTNSTFLICSFMTILLFS